LRDALGETLDRPDREIEDIRGEERWGVTSILGAWP
jgi:hypothetical protein